MLCCLFVMNHISQDLILGVWADALRMFGGSDATTHYYMLHPHLELRSKALEPFKIRKAVPVVNAILDEN